MSGERQGQTPCSPMSSGYIGENDFEEKFPYGTPYIYKGGVALIEGERLEGPVHDAMGTVERILGREFSGQYGLACSQGVYHLAAGVRAGG